METAAEVGIPGVTALLAFFGFAALRLWPLARKRLDDTNRCRVGAAMAVVLAVAGFASSGQFVSLAGLEVPYYVVMVGAAVLKAPVRVAQRSSEDGMSAAGNSQAPVAVAIAPRRQPARTGRLLPPLGVQLQGAQDPGGKETRRILPQV
jgi:hypothetical protein